LIGTDSIRGLKYELITDRWYELITDIWYMTGAILEFSGYRESSVFLCEMNYERLIVIVWLT